MSYFSDADILNARDEQDFVAIPFQWNSLQEYFYQIRLGPTIIRSLVSDPENDTQSTLTPWQEGSLKQHWGQPEPPHNEGDIIVLAPGESILACTHEFLMVRSPVVAHFEGLPEMSSFGLRIDGRIIEPDITRWAMTITNINQRSKVSLRIGDKIARVILTTCMNDPLGAHNEPPINMPTLDHMAKKWQGTEILADLKDYSRDQLRKLMGADSDSESDLVTTYASQHFDPDVEPFKFERFQQPHKSGDPHLMRSSETSGHQQRPRFNQQHHRGGPYGQATTDDTDDSDYSDNHSRGDVDINHRLPMNRQERRQAQKERNEQNQGQQGQKPKPKFNNKNARKKALRMISKPVPKGSKKVSRDDL